MAIGRQPLNLISSRREAHYAAHDVRQELKRLQAQHKATIAALRARRLELRAEHKAKRADTAAQFRKAIADLRAAAKQAQADLRAEYRARLRDINAEIRAAREELRGLTPLAREELRLIMLRGENLKSAKAKLAGSKGAQKKNDTIEEALTEILYGLGIDRFSDASKEMIAYIKRWLTKRAKKGASALERMHVYDPKKDAWEQWTEYAEAFAEDIAARQAEWVDAQVEREHERERKHMEEAHEEMENLAKRAHKVLAKAAQCADPWTYSTLEGLHERLPEVEYWNSDKLRRAKDELDKEAAHVVEECKRNTKKRTLFRKEAARGEATRRGVRARKRGVAKTPRPTRQQPAKAHKRGAVKVERAKARKARKALKAPIPVRIEYGAEVNRNSDASGWVPQLWVDGYPKLPAGSPKGYELDRALLHAEMEAHNEAKDWGKEYRASVTMRTPKSRPTLRPHTRAAAAPEAPKARKAKPPKEPKAPKADPSFAKLSPIDRLLTAYRELKSETGLRNVRIYALAKRARMTPRQAHSVLATLSRRGLVNPAFGEPTAVSAEERAAAWPLDGQRFMLVEIDEPAAPVEPVRTPKPTKPRRGGSGAYLLDDERVILAAHQRLDTRGDNMTLLFDLRKETGIKRARFDAAIQSLRKAGRAYLESSQGQAVKLTAAQRAAGITEDGRNLVYFSLR